MLLPRVNVESGKMNRTCRRPLWRARGRQLQCSVETGRPPHLLGTLAMAYIMSPHLPSPPPPTTRTIYGGRGTQHSGRNKRQLRPRVVSATRRLFLLCPPRTCAAPPRVLLPQSRSSKAALWLISRPRDDLRSSCSFFCYRAFHRALHDPPSHASRAIFIFRLSRAEPGHPFFVSSSDRHLHTTRFCSSRRTPPPGCAYPGTSTSPS